MSSTKTTDARASGTMRETAADVMTAKAAKASKAAGDTDAALESAASDAAAADGVELLDAADAVFLLPEGAEGEEGISVDQALSPGLLLPVPKGDAARDWITKHVVVKGKGTRLKVGRLFGRAIRTERKTNTVNGEPVESILCIGEFGMQSTLTGREFEHSDLYLPMGYAKRLEAKLALDPENVATFDVDVILEATGRNITYAWRVESHIRDTSPALAALRNARRISVTPIAGLLN